MLIEIDRLPQEGLRVARDFDFPSADLVEEAAVFLEPVHADLLVRKVGEEVWIKGRLTTRLSFVCGRCLTPYELPVDSRFDLVFLPEEMETPKDELGEADLDTLYHYDRKIDIRAVVLEQLNLTFPPKPLCSESCEGLCAVCGELVRDGKCSCLVRETEPRLDKLKSLVRDKG
jgi:uncharacterized protein